MEEQNRESFANLSTDEKLVHVYQLMWSEKNLAKERYDDIKKEISEVKQEISNTNVKVAAIEKKCNDLNIEVKRLKVTVNDIQQAAFECDLFLRGVPQVETDDDDLLSIVQSILQKIDCFATTTLCAVQRIGLEVEGKNDHRPILLKFSSSEEKYKVLAAKKKKTIKCSEIISENGPIGSDKQLIFLDEHLTRATTDLFYAARQLRKHGLVKYAWIKRGKVMVKCSDGDRAMRITNMEQINQLNKRKLNSTPESDAIERMVIGNNGDAGGSKPPNTKKYRKELKQPEQFEGVQTRQSKKPGLFQGNVI